MATIATMSMLNAKCLTTNPPPSSTTKPASIRPLSLPKVLPISKPSNISTPAATAIAGAFFSTLSFTNAAFAAQQIADIAEGSDNRGLALLLPLVPAIGWVLFNILQPALNQLNRMRNEKAVAVGLGIGGSLAAAGLMSTPSVSAAAELASIADAAAASSSDSRGQLLLFVVAPAIGWVLFNILQPALNQLNRMRSE